MLLRLAGCDITHLLLRPASVFAAPLLQLLLDADQVGLQELQFGCQQLRHLLLGSHSSQFTQLRVLQVRGRAEGRQGHHLLLDLQEDLLQRDTNLMKPMTLSWDLRTQSVMEVTPDLSSMFARSKKWVTVTGNNHNNNHNNNTNNNNNNSFLFVSRFHFP